MSNVLTVPELLLDANGKERLIDQGESCNVVNTLYDATGASLTTAAILTLTATLSNAANSAAINSRNAQDILPTNGGGVTDGRTLPDAHLDLERWCRNKNG